MKKFILIFILFFFSPAFCQVLLQAQEISSSKEKTLKEVYFEALNNSETIIISQEAVRKASALYRQAMGNSLPEFLYRRQSSFEDKIDSEHDGMFRMEINDFTGYGELALIRSRKAQIDKNSYEFQRVKQLLLKDISQVFYSILLAQENVAATKKLLFLADKRLEELKERMRVGRTREADVVAQKALIASFESQLEESMRQFNERKDLLSFLTGSSTENVILKDIPIITKANLLEYYLKLSENRPDLKAAVENLNAEKNLLALTKSRYIPSLNVSANSFTDRSNPSNYGDWNVTLTVDVPIWDWSNRRGSLDAAKSDLNIADKTLQLLRRQAELEIRNAYRDYESSKNQLSIIQKGLEFARRDYEIQAQDDKQGLVSNLEVFESLNRLNNAELALNSARLDEKITAINLEIASGKNPEEILE